MPSLLERILGDPLVGQVVVETVYVDMSFHFQHIAGTKLIKNPGLYGKDTRFRPANKFGAALGFHYLCIR